MLDHRVGAITRVADGFVVSTSQETITARHVVLATGGRSLPKSGSDGFGYELARALGHTIVPTTPALAPIVLAPTPDALHVRLSGVAHEAELVLWIDGRIRTRLQGALLWTHFGISGPVALNMSRHWIRARLTADTGSIQEDSVARREPSSVAVTVSFLPEMTPESADGWLRAMAAERPRASFETLLAARLPRSVAEALCDSLGVSGGDEARAASQRRRDERRRVARALTEWPLVVQDTRGYNFAEATAGGVSMEEIDPATLESRKCPGLFLVGEILDVDGRIGGFNFQWAWASARVVARSLAQTAR
jgi:predicted Rossmann fold flavoprotein